jgi:nicotinamidase-related amidase
VVAKHFAESTRFLKEEAHMNILEPTHSRIDAQDVVILFADLQGGILELTQTNPPAQLKKSVKALAKLARLFEIPVFVTGIQGEDGSPAKITPEIAEVLGELPTYHRTTCDSFRNPEIVAAIEATGRKTLLLSGVATELAVQLPALSASDQGYKAYVVLDACGGMSERTEQAALLRIGQAGGTAVSVMTLAGELAGDFREPKAQQAVGILFEMAQ